MSDTTSMGGASGISGTQIAQGVQEKSAQGASVVTQQASEVAETAKQQAAAVTQEAGAQARALASQLRDQLSGETRAQGERLVQNLRGLADELEGMGEHGQSDSVVTSVVRRLAAGGHQVADHLEQRGPGGLLDEVQDFARRRPGLFLAGAALAGFAVARTGKGVIASSSDSGTGSGGNASGRNANGVGTGVSGSTGFATAPTPYETPLPGTGYAGGTVGSPTTSGGYAQSTPATGTVAGAGSLSGVGSGSTPTPAAASPAAPTAPLPSSGTAGQWSEEQWPEEQWSQEQRSEEQWPRQGGSR